MLIVSFSLRLELYSDIHFLMALVLAAMEKNTAIALLCCSSIKKPTLCIASTGILFIATVFQSRVLGWAVWPADMAPILYNSKSSLIYLRETIYRGIWVVVLFPR